MTFSVFENPILFALFSTGFILLILSICIKKYSYIFNMFFGLIVIIFIFVSLYYSVELIEILIFISLYIILYFLVHSLRRIK